MILLATQAENIFSLKKSIYSIEVDCLVDEPFAAGNYKVDRDAGGLESGMYFYRIQVGREFAQTKKLILMN
jgi:hypothetical protein